MMLKTLNSAQTNGENPNNTAETPKALTNAQNFGEILENIELDIGT